MKTKTFHITAVLIITAPLLFMNCFNAERNNTNDPGSDKYLIGVTLKLGDGTVLADGSTITGHEPISVSFTDPVESCSVSGEMGNAMAAGNLALVDEMTYTITPGVGNVYPEGPGQRLVLSCTPAEGNPVYESYTFTTEYAVYVSKDTGDDGNAGTSTAHMKTIQTGIDYADSLYATAVVKVAATTTTGYTKDYRTDSAPVISMKNGISVKGGYSTSNWTTQNTNDNETIIIDTSASGGSTSDPNRAVTCGTGFTGATVFDGFTITMGNGDHNAAIFCEDTEDELTIQNCNIQGRTSDSDAGQYSYGIYNDTSSAIITNNTIQPGWNSKTGTDKSYGIYNTGSSSTINQNTIYGGYGDITYAISEITGSTSTITYNTLYSGGGSSNSYSIYIMGLLGACSPVINNNTINVLGYGIYEADADADPTSLSNNNFENTGIWYYDEGGTTQVTDSNYNVGGNEITINGDTELITYWGNY
jgi:hypothetical protein